MNLNYNEVRVIIKDLEDFSEILKLAGNHKRGNEIDEHIKTMKIKFADKILQSDTEIDFEYEEEEVEYPDDMPIPERHGREIPADFYDDFDDEDYLAYVVEVELPNNKTDYFRFRSYDGEIEKGDFVVVPYRDGVYVTEVLGLRFESEMRQASVNGMKHAEPLYSNMRTMLNVVISGDYRTLLVQSGEFHEGDEVVYTDKNGKKKKAEVNFIYKSALEENTFYPYARVDKE